MLSLFYQTTVLYQFNRSHCHLTIDKYHVLPTNLFVYSNAATSLRSDLSNTGLENVIYCSTTTDAGPIQNFTEMSLSSGIPYSMKDIYQV